MLKKINDMCDIKDRLIDMLNTHTAMDPARIDTKEVGMVTDAIKDLSEAIEKCYEAMYYDLICESMLDERGEGSGKYGYDNWRYSSGRFAPTGRGHYSGYREDTRMDPAIHRMGYHEDGRDVGEIVTSIKENMRTADPETKRKMKTDLANLLGEIN